MDLKIESRQGRKPPTTYGSSTQLGSIHHRSVIAPQHQGHAPIQTKRADGEAAVKPSKAVSATQPTAEETRPRTPKQPLPVSRKRNHAAAFQADAVKAHDASSSPRGATKNRAASIAYEDGNVSATLIARTVPVRKETSSPARGSGNQKAPRLGRTRLIDTLSAQKNVSLGDEQAIPITTTLRRGSAESESHTPQRIPVDRVACAQVADRRVSTPTWGKAKVTYSQARSIASASQHADDATLPTIQSFDVEREEEVSRSEVHLRSSVWDPFSADGEDDDDDVPRPAIKSVHELRRAGANHRVSDEMDDLLGRVVSPGAGPAKTRRDALCELALRLNKKTFIAQFRDHACRDQIANRIGEEEDLVSGFALVAVLVTFVLAEPAPHLLRQICEQGVGKLMGRLLHKGDGITTLASGVESRHTRQSLRSIEDALLKLPIWHGLTSTSVSPRTLSLQLLDVVSGRLDGQLLVKVFHDVEAGLIRIAAVCADPDCKTSVDRAILLFTLETLSTAGLTPGLTWQAPRAPKHPQSIACFFRQALQRWPDRDGELEVATLKTAIDITNMEQGAEAFDDADLLSLLAACIARGLTEVQGAIGRGRLEDKSYDGLLLLMGVMINVMEHWPPARDSIRCDALDELLRLWKKNHSAVSEAESVDQSKGSIAVGYLSVLLGYLYLTKRGQEMIEQRLGRGEGVTRLVASIRDFVTLYKTVDSKVQALENLILALRRQDGTTG